MVQPVPEIRPSVGFCIQTESQGTPAGRWYLNMTRHRAVEMPIAHSGKVITKDFILQHGIGSMKIPFDMGSFRKLKERAEGAKQTAYCVDVVFNPFIVSMFMDDDFNKTMEAYRPFIINLVLGRVESSIGVKLSAQKVKLVKKFLYKDGEGNSGETPREFTELPQEMEMDSTEEVCPPRKPSKAAGEPSPEPEPLIQDVTPGKKPALKKGFLNSGKATELYPNGSNEGVLPENAGDPMGWMPKKLRQTSRIVDCNSPEYQAQEKQKREAEKHNAQQKEFQDMIKADLGSWQKHDSHWSQDLPDGETDATRKYSNDYSRFDALPDVEDKPAIEERDWYYDSNGKPQQISKTSKAPVTGEAEKPAIKKGFFDNAKAPLYPKGSEQRSPLDDKELLKKMGDMKMDDLLGEDMKGMEELFGKDMKGMEELLGKDFKPPARGEEAPKQPTVKAKVAERKAPEFTLDRVPDEGLQLVVAVPGLESMQGVDLDVTDLCASLAFPSSVGLKPLKVELPEKVLPGSVRAKFSKKTHQITVKLPLAS